MRRIPYLIGLPVAAVALTACSSGSPAASSAPPAAPAATSAATLGPLTLGPFPSTHDGKLARGICQAWSGLRSQYAANVGNDSPVQLNQWFSGPSWHVVLADGTALGNAPAFSGLEAALGVATTGDTASIPSARALDAACAKG